MPEAGIEPVYLHSPCFDSRLSMNSVAPSGRYRTETLAGAISLLAIGQLSGVKGKGADLYNQAYTPTVAAVTVRALAKDMALQTATFNDADLLGWSSKVGTIEAGKWADIIAVEGDPLKDVTTLEHVKFVMKGGEVYKNEYGK